MIFEASINSNKTQKLVECYFKLIQEGVMADEILILVQNGKKKKEFSELIKKNSPQGNIGNLNIFSFFGLARNQIERNWALVENCIKNQNSKIIPNLCGLEISQYIFKNCIKEVEFKGYNSKINLLHQLFKRYSLIVQNNLSEDEIKEREKILKEAWADDAKLAIDLYKKETINLRAFDYLRQMGIFQYIYKNTKCPYKYVIIDDADEITPICFDYLKEIKPNTKEFFIAKDSYGASRMGYLSAANIDFEKFLNQKAIELDPQNKKRETAIELFLKVNNNEQFYQKDVEIKTFVKNNEMLEDLKKELHALLKNGTSPNEIAIAIPQTDEYFRHSLNTLKYDFFYLSGSEKLNENQTIGAIIELLKIINIKNYYSSPFVLKGVLSEIFKINNDEIIEIYKQYKSESAEIKINTADFLEKINNEKINEFLTLAKTLTTKTLGEQLQTLMFNYIEQKIENQKNILKLNKLAKQIFDFEEVFQNNFTNSALIEQLENTIISENPLSEDEIPKNAIIVASPQKLIDSAITCKHLFLVDAQNSNWIKQDIGMLYNSWVFQKSWTGRTFEPKDNVKLTLDRTARILYKLYLSQSEKMHVYSSIYDSLGVENFGGIEAFFDKEKQKEKPKFNITPRPDQKPVLDYKSGRLAINATAGSGKTTIMLALIMKLLDKSPIENLEAKNIFVLTFMDSAARNFKERIKQNFPDLNELPHISTIHGLALKILKENNNYSLVNLNDDFEIIDESKQKEIIGQILAEFEIGYDKIDLYQKAISDFKNEGAQIANAKKSPSFKIVFKNYQKELSKNNLVDYDDLLMLALKLLKTNGATRKYYQDLAKIIIEDEAQDSSPTQQELISILGAKSGNIIRCGDVNQAITSTFSNSDVVGFKKFIKDNKQVKMNYTQRCATNVINCANEFINYSKNQAPQAFLDIEMKPVDGINSKIEGEVIKSLFETEIEEKNYIIKQIEKIKQEDKNTSIAILTRSNHAINIWGDFIASHNFAVVKNFDILSNNPVFSTVLAIFNFIFAPNNKKILDESLNTLLKLDKYADESEVLYFAQKNDFLNSQGEKYQLWWDLKYFLNKNYISPMELVLEIGNFYFSKNSQSSNVAMVYSIIKKVYQTQKNFENTTLRLREIANRPNKSVKFFEDEKNQDTQAIKIMTLHKSKGDEFDYVFIPELTSSNLGLSVNEIKLKENTKFLQQIKKQPKTDETIKQEIVDENYRLLYVGITRAKLKLYLSCAKKYKIYKKEQEKTPCKIFTRGEDEI